MIAWKKVILDCSVAFELRVLGQNGLLPKLNIKTGLLPKLNIKTGLLPKLLFKVAPIYPHKHKNHFYAIFVYFPNFPSRSLFNFSLQTLAPPVGHCERDIVGATKHQGWGWSQSSFWLVLCKVFGIFPFFSHLIILVFRNIFFPLLLLFSFVYVLHCYFRKKWFVIIQRFKPLRCRRLLKFMGKMIFFGNKWNFLGINEIF